MGQLIICIRHLMFFFCSLRRVIAIINQITVHYQNSKCRICASSKSSVQNASTVFCPIRSIHCVPLNRSIAFFARFTRLHVLPLISHSNSICRLGCFSRLIRTSQRGRRRSDAFFFVVAQIFPFRFFSLRQSRQFTVSMLQVFHNVSLVPFDRWMVS